VRERKKKRRDKMEEGRKREEVKSYNLKIRIFVNEFENK
jgi:hypothetical protein